MKKIFSFENWNTGNSQILIWKPFKNIFDYFFPGFSYASHLSMDSNSTFTSNQF